jgi:histidyl-tRNA synthetase
MSKAKQYRPKPLLPRGLRDVEAAELRAMEKMLARIRKIYELYGFEPLETPALEYSEILGKFLPDQERPNAGVFSLQDDDQQWVSLRYDLTAPLARYVAANFDALPKPFRRYQTGSVWRNEKPGPGRFRQFTQFDADTVGAPGMAADAEFCMLAAECMEALGIARGSYIIRVNNRKLLDGVLAGIGVEPDSSTDKETRLTILRAIDKLDRLGMEGVEQLLGDGRKDSSGDFTKGAGLSLEQIRSITDFLSAKGDDREETLNALEKIVPENSGTDELRQINKLLNVVGFGPDRIIIDPTVVRGLEYYTGTVFEAELTFETADETGAAIRFGSVGGGGRYDRLVERFKGVQVPATGISIGISRLYTALKTLGKINVDDVSGPVLVLVMDKGYIEDYQRMVFNLRSGGIQAEMYLGSSGMRAQMKYADRRSAPCVIIQGEDERAKGEVTVKDLVEGARMSKAIKDNMEWRSSRPAQFQVSEEGMLEAVHKILAQHKVQA